MDASFYTSEQVSKETLQVLMRRSNFPALTQFLTMLALILVTAVWAVLAWNGAWWNLALSQIGFGVMVCSTFACLHETAHGTAFESRRLNRFAAFLTGLFHLYPSSLFRELHFAHHRHTHIPGLDPEISLGNRPAPSVISNLPMYLGWLSGLPLLLFKVGMLIAVRSECPKCCVRIFIHSFVRECEERSRWKASLFCLSSLDCCYWRSTFIPVSGRSLPDKSSATVCWPPISLLNTMAYHTMETSWRKPGVWIRVA
jgi:hypothetical protein